MGILLYKVHEGFLLLRGQCNPLPGIIDHHTSQREVEGVLADNILITGHLKGWFDNAPDTGDSAVSPSVLPKLHQPQLSVVEKALIGTAIVSYQGPDFHYNISLNGICLLNICIEKTSWH